MIITKGARRSIRCALLLPALWAAVPGIGAAQGVDRALRASIAGRGGPHEVRSFYAARANQPLWIVDGHVSPAAEKLLDLIASARLDGLDPDDYRPRALVSALKGAASGSPKALGKAEAALTGSFVALARDMRRSRDVGVVYPDAVLRPRVPGVRELLAEAASAPSMADYLDRIGWMNPLYTELRLAALARGAPGVDGVEEEPTDSEALRANLDRLRALPADLGRRYVLVDAASARLWMVADGRAQGTMRVVVGKTAEPTPLMAALIKYASLNPYWNLPPDLARSRIAAGALSQGPSFLTAKRYQVLSDWSDDARPVDPSTVDWQAVADGRIEARVRQLPGPGNAMGRVKFMFPNDKGVYLHDTPDKKLLKEDDRQFSAGCVRLEDAPRLGRWLTGRALPIARARTEQRLDLPQPVPVYIVYRTIAVENGRLVSRPDFYRRDGGGRRYAAR